MNRLYKRKKQETQINIYEIPLLGEKLRRERQILEMRKIAEQERRRSESVINSLNEQSERQRRINQRILSTSISYLNEPSPLQRMINQDSFFN